MNMTYPDENNLEITLKDNKKTTILILIGILFFAIHTLVFINIHMMNFPWGDDFHYMRFQLIL